MASLLWLRGGGCSGDTMSFLNAEEPTVCDIVTDFGIDLIWHPSLDPTEGHELRAKLDACASGEIEVDILMLEGAVVRGPDGSGRFDGLAGRAMKDWIADIAPISRYVIGIGDCATWGGMAAVAPNPTDAVGLQYLKRDRGGFLGADFRSAAGFPVINIPGCPAHPDWITHTLLTLAGGRADDLALDTYNRPQTFFATYTQTGCVRSMHFTYKVPAAEFGRRKGCLFFDLGCRGPMTHSSCNRILWNRQSSKTRAGMPCIGCTEPDFPVLDLAPGSVFATPTIMGVPKELPPGTDKKRYVAFSAASKAAAPEWIEKDLFLA